jgi:ABC-type polysaccharide/polyol phosphate export permease
MFRQLAIIRSNLRLIRELAKSSHHSQYFRMFLGTLWSHVEPLLYLLIYWFFVAIVWGRTSTSSGHPVVVIIYSGIIAYSWLVRMLIGSTNAILSKDSLLLSLPLHPVIFVGANAFEELIKFASSISIFIIVSICLGVKPTWYWLLCPLIVLVQFVLQFALGTVLGVIGVYVRDLSTIMGLIARMLVFISPVMYEIDRIPEKYQWLFMCNPLAILIQAYRDILIYGKMPEGYYMAGLVAFTILLSIFALQYIDKQGRYLAKEL